MALNVAKSVGSGLLFSGFVELGMNSEKQPLNSSETLESYQTNARRSGVVHVECKTGDLSTRGITPSRIIAKEVRCVSVGSGKKAPGR
jgi:hypothetical protein